MGVSSVALFIAALGLTEPWTVVRVELSPEQGQFDVWLGFSSSGTFACPERQRPGCRVHDTTERS